MTRKPMFALLAALLAGGASPAAAQGPFARPAAPVAIAGVRTTYINVANGAPGVLAMGMTGHREFLAAEQIYDLAASRDKTLAFVEGAGHTYETCQKCEATPGQFGDTTRTTYDYIDRWLSAPGRFLGR